MSGGVGSDTFVSDWCMMVSVGCRIGVGSVSDVSGGVGSDTFVSYWCRIGVGCVGWCRMCRVVSEPTHLCRIGVGSDTFVSDRCRIG